MFTWTLAPVVLRFFFLVFSYVAGAASLHLTVHFRMGRVSSKGSYLARRRRAEVSRRQTCHFWNRVGHIFGAFAGHAVLPVEVEFMDHQHVTSGRNSSQERSSLVVLRV